MPSGAMLRVIGAITMRFGSDSFGDWNGSNRTAVSVMESSAGDGVRAIWVGLALHQAPYQGAKKSPSLAEQDHAAAAAREFYPVRRQAPHRFGGLERRLHRFLFRQKTALASDDGRGLGEQVSPLETIAPGELHAIGRDADGGIVDRGRYAVRQVDVLPVDAWDTVLADQIRGRNDRSGHRPFVGHRTRRFRGGAGDGRGRCL